MTDYRRHRVPGGCYFFTVNLLERRGNTLLTDRIDLLRKAVRRVRRSRPFSIDAWVVLPDHLHAVWTLPPGDDDFFSIRWRLIKSFFVRELAKMGIPFTDLWGDGSVRGWTAPNILSVGSITHGRSRRWTSGSAATRDAGSISGASVGRRVSPALTAA